LSEEVPAGAWAPLLTGAAADDARAAVEEIAAALSDPDQSRIERENAEYTLGMGHAGIALFFAYLAKSRPGAGHDETALRYLEEAIESLSARAYPAALYHGVSGIAWVVEHFDGWLLEAEAEGDDLNEASDEVVLDRLAVPAWTDDYDLINGLVGFGFCARARLPRPAATESLSHILRHLEATAEVQPRGLTWWTPPERLWGPLREAAAPKGFYNLGVAHGVAGVIPLLADCCAAGVEAERARALLAGAVDWLLSQQLAASRFAFPDFVGPEIQPKGSMLAWCYGDVGIAGVLLRAARAAGEPRWEEEALALARRAALCSEPDANVRDACLCHGEVGLGHQFHRLFRATGEPVFQQAALAWYQRGLARRRPGEAIGGFVAREPRSFSGDFEDVPRRGFLVGSAGIGLGLLAALEPVEPAWDRLLLLS
jgi:lantibiotic biosynthesis protein